MRKNFLLFLGVLLFSLLPWSGCVNDKRVMLVTQEEQKKELREPGEQKIAQLLEAAEQGDAEAQYQIGYEYIRPLPETVRYRTGPGIVQGEGIRGIRWYSKDTQQRFFFFIDREEGIKWLRRAAEQGHVEAQYQLGMAHALTFRFLEDGTRESTDFEEGIQWLHKAAEQGHAGAHFILGHHYLHRGDKTEAIQWFRRAELMGDPGASALLQRLDESTE